MDELRDTDPIAWLSACEEIRQLASRYAVWYGARDTRNLAGLFVPDIKVTRETSGTDALLAALMAEMKAVESASRPAETLLVVDSLTGQLAAAAGSIQETKVEIRALVADVSGGEVTINVGTGAVTGDTSWSITVKGAFSDTAAAVTESVVVSDFFEVV